MSQDRLVSGSRDLGFRSDLSSLPVLSLPDPFLLSVFRDLCAIQLSGL